MTFDLQSQTWPLRSTRTFEIKIQTLNFYKAQIKMDIFKKFRFFAKMRNSALDFDL